MQERIVLEQVGIPPKERHEKVFEGNRHIAKQKTSTYLREIELLVFMGQYDEVIDILNTAEFVESEGSRTLREVYCDAYILRSLWAYKAGDYEAATRDMQVALDYPVGRWGSDRRAQMNYLMGTCYEEMDDNVASQDCYEKASAEIVEGTEYHYEKGLAFRKLGQTENARREFIALLDMVNRGGADDVFRSFEVGSGGSVRQAQNHYLRGLAYLGMGRQNEARAQFSMALDLDPANVWADHMLNN